MMGSGSAKVMDSSDEEGDEDDASFHTAKQSLAESGVSEPQDTKEGVF